MEVLDQRALVNNMGDNLGNDKGILLSGLGIIGTMIWFPFTASWWIASTLIRLPGTLASWFASAISLAFMIISRLLQLVLLPFQYLWWLLLWPLPRSWTLDRVIDTIGPIPTCIFFAATVGIVAGLATYAIAFAISYVTTDVLTERPSSKLTAKNENFKKLKGTDTPLYDSDTPNGRDRETPFFDTPNSSSRRSSFLDFDTDDAMTLQHRTGTTAKQQQQRGPDLYDAWRERVEGGNRSSGGSGSDGLLRSPPVLLSPAGGGGGGAGSGPGSSSKRRLPGLLFGTTIHEEDDDSL
ncbi:hypothetical protein QBC37DRAFT_135338 [Rhypophila decipiens]|uniref:Uncharacterized protein n=1 Tax=Rhypophila decipiens TaxID=261697 RepID=A0AAN6YIY6_9PEZI|nr:hypothetical protein QBC37DRAFT_135338 [Rhypophila decipiens]